MQKEVLEKQLVEVAQQEKNLAKKFSQISTARLMAVLVATVGFIGGVMERNGLYVGIGVVGVAVFLVLLVQHSKIANARAYSQNEQAVLRRYVARYDQGWQSFDDTGEDFMAPDWPQAVDMDLLGKASLYQYLSVAHTVHGREALAKSLHQLSPKRAEILERQAAVAELAEKWDFAVRFETLSHQLAGQRLSVTKASIEQFVQFAEGKSAALPAWVRACAWGLPVVTVVAMVLTLAGFLSPHMVAICICVQLAFAMLGYSRIMSLLEPLFSLHHCIEAYQQLFEAVEQETFRSPYLQKWQKKLLKGQGASGGIGQLRGIGQAVNLRYNVVLYWPAAGLLMWSYHCVFALERWKSAYGRQLRQWLEAVGEVEALLSLAVLVQVKPATCFPEIKEEAQPFFAGEGIAHPLIDVQKVVTNSLTLAGRTCILTGSNMSGKTTFLRSIGVNLVLAYAGAPVCAQRFSASCMAILTSMRVHDDVSQGISTFYAEMLRIKTMVQYSQEQKPMLVLVDEIFKGTNSADRLIGARAVIKKLAQPWVIAMVSTHDFELCDLDRDPAVRAVNYHFSEYYVGDEIHFDYLMQEGRCQTTNAQQLMRMAGLI